MRPTNLIILLMLVFSISAPCHSLAGKGIFNCGGYPRLGDYGRNDPNVVGKELLFEWREIEPEEGVYNWKLVDDAIKPWADAGKMLALRVMSACNEKNASPMWVFEKCGVPKIDSRDFSKSNIIYPVFWNPVFERKYENMVRELAKRYDGDPRIEFVQVGGVGRWEETYVHTENKEMSKRWQELGYTHERYISHCKKMVDIFKRNFKKTPVLLSISIGGPDAKVKDRKSIGYELADYAVERGLYLKQNGLASRYSYTDHEHFGRIFTSLRGKAKRVYEQGYPATNPWGGETSTFRSHLNRMLIDCPDYLWIYEEDISKPEFAKDIDFAVKHLSMKSYREAGPLYIRLKQFKCRYEKPYYDAVFEDEFYGLFSHADGKVFGVQPKLEPKTIAGVDCKATTPEQPFFYIDVDDSAILQESNGTGNIPRATMDIWYWDEGNDTITIEHSPDGVNYLSLYSLKTSDEKRWKKVRIHLHDLKFTTTLSTAENDFRIGASSGKLALERIEMRLY